MISDKVNQSKKYSKILAPCLSYGDTIGIAAPAGVITEKQLNIAIKKVEQAGYKAKVADGICNKYGYLAGDDESRANQINSLFADKDVKAIVCARGGFGTTRILDKIDYDLICKNPKIIGGYSDITALLIAINKVTGLITFHSSMLIPEENQYTRKSMWDIFESGFNGYNINCDLPDLEYVEGFNGNCKGTLIGGNLCLLESLIGTKYDFSLNNKILFLEEINEPPYKIDRMLTHISNSKSFGNLRGIIFGKLQGCEAQGNNSLSLNQVLNDFTQNLKIPIIKNFSFGHVISRCTFPIGAKVLLNTEKRQVTLLEDVVER